MILSVNNGMVVLPILANAQITNIYMYVYNDRCLCVKHI